MLHKSYKHTHTSHSQRDWIIEQCLVSMRNVCGWHAFALGITVAAAKVQHRHQRCDRTHTTTKPAARPATRKCRSNFCSEFVLSSRIEWTNNDVDDDDGGKNTVRWNRIFCAVGKCVCVCAISIQYVYVRMNISLYTQSRSSGMETQTLTA